MIFTCKRLKFAALVAVALLLAGFFAWFFWGPVPRRIDTDFATRARLRYHYNDNSIDVVMSPRDLAVVKSLVRGRAYGEAGIELLSPNNFCVKDALSITLEGRDHSITFVPDLEGQAILQVGDHNSYLSLSTKQYKDLRNLCRKYGVKWPGEAYGETKEETPRQ